MAAKTIHDAIVVGLSTGELKDSAKNIKNELMDMLAHECMKHSFQLRKEFKFKDDQKLIEFTLNSFFERLFPNE